MPRQRKRSKATPRETMDPVLRPAGESPCSANLERCRLLLEVVASPADDEPDLEDANEQAWRPRCNVCEEGLLVVIEALAAVPENPPKPSARA